MTEEMKTDIKVRKEGFEFSKHLFMLSPSLTWLLPDQEVTFWVKAERLGQSLVKDLISWSNLLVARVRMREQPQGCSNLVRLLWS